MIEGAVTLLANLPESKPKATYLHRIVFGEAECPLLWEKGNVRSGSDPTVQQSADQQDKEDGHTQKNPSADLGGRGGLWNLHLENELLIGVLRHQVRQRSREPPRGQSHVSGEHRRQACDALFPDVAVCEENSIEAGIHPETLRQGQGTVVPQQIPPEI